MKNTFIRNPKNTIITKLKSVKTAFSYRAKINLRKKTIFYKEKFMSMKKLELSYYYCPVQNKAFQRFTCYNPDYNIWQMTLISFDEQLKEKVRFGTQFCMRRVDNKSYELHQQCTDPEIEFEVKRLTHKQAFWWLFSNGFPMKHGVIPEELFFKYYERTIDYLYRSSPKDPDR